MTTPQPVNGNQYYKIVQTLAEQIPRGNISELNSISATVSGLLNAPTQRHGVWDYTTVVAYAPTSFTSEASYTLMAVEASAAATTLLNPNILTIPAGSQVVLVEIDNNGVALAGTGAEVALGLGTVLNTSATALATATAFATINTGCIVGNASVAFGSDAVARNVVAVASQSILVATISGAALTSGDLRVSVTYRTPVA